MPTHDVSHIFIELGLAVVGLAVLARLANSKLTILNEGVLFQDIAFVPEPSDHGFDIFYFPAQDRTLQCSEIRTFAIRILCPPTLMTSAY